MCINYVFLCIQLCTIIVIVLVYKHQQNGSMIYIHFHAEIFYCHCKIVNIYTILKCIQNQWSLVTKFGHIIISNIYQFNYYKINYMRVFTLSYIVIINMYLLLLCFR